MRNRFTWFLLGCATGVVGLYGTLWKVGVLTPYLAQVRADSRAEVADSPKPKATPVQSKAPLPVAPAPAVPSAAMVPPIEGLKAADVLDTFNQSRPGGRPHEATDIMEPRGTPVHAIVDGVVKKLFLSKPGGITVYQFDDAQEYCYYYAHLDRYADGLKEGQHLQRGTVIGFVGSTGNAAADAPHLHLAIFKLGEDKRWWEGTPVDPHPILLKIIQP
jgi:murein DD-endopeptidase MepM/ murein hydrolase activator NlpD